jgi:hypothetical protein
MLIALGALVMTASAAPKKKAIKTTWTLCDPALNWCNRGEQCVSTKLAVSATAGTGNTLDTATWETSSWTRCVPCPWDEQTGNEVQTGATGFQLSNDASY